MSTTLVTVQLVHIDCCKCHVPFGLARDHYDRAQATGQEFFCTNGHAQVFRTTETQRLKDELAREKHKAEQAQASANRAWQRVEEERLEKVKTEHRLRATRGVVTRHKRKITKGLCPCCSQKFPDLKAHMRTEHPKWNPDREAEVLAAKATPRA